MSEKVLIGRICEKGPHVTFVGDSDFGACAGHEYASVYLTVEEDRPNPRGQSETAEGVAEDLAYIIREYERLAEKDAWDRYEAEQRP